MKYILIIPITLLLVGCCGENYVKEMKGISSNTTQQLVEFYKNNKRYPTIKERNKLFEAVGCTFKQENICSYNGRDITIESRDSNIGYLARLYLGKNMCFFGLNLDGSADSIRCRKDDCIKIGQ